jgi:hypothetical protein
LNSSKEKRYPEDVSMRPHSTRKIVLVASAALLSAACGPVSAMVHDPRALPALAHDSRVHYDEGAENYAEAVAELLPRAMAKIESVHGRPFGRPFVVAAYLDEATYADANGRGGSHPAGVAFLDRVSLAPRLWRDERNRLASILTHELSHEHLWSHLSALDYLSIPAWFVEGLAVMASDGGGADRVSEAAARKAISRGCRINTPDDPNPLTNISLKAPSGCSSGEADDLGAHMAYRQAGMFVTLLCERDPLAFKALLDRLMDGERFKSAFETSFRSSVAENWTRFANEISRN